MLEQACEDAFESGLLKVNGEANEKILGLLNDVIQDLVPVIKELSKLSTPARLVADSQVLDKSKIKPIFSELEELIDDFDTDASDVLEQLEPLFQGTEYYQQVSELIEAVDAYDFDTAMTIFSALKAQLDE